MENTDEKLDTFGKELCKQKRVARASFFEICPQARGLLDIMDCYFSTLCNNLRKTSITTERKDDIYQSKLVISFIRTYYVINHLTVDSDLIEANTLIRKQLELLARIEEIVKNREYENPKKLEGKTPNVACLGNIKGSYGQLSEIAHSAKEETLDLLGVEATEENVGYQLMPVYSNNTLITFSNQINVTLNFVVEMFRFQEELLGSNTEEEHELELLNSFIELGKCSNIPYFKNWEMF